VRPIKVGIATGREGMEKAHGVAHRHIGLSGVGSSGPGIVSFFFAARAFARAVGLAHGREQTREQDTQDGNWLWSQSGLHWMEHRMSGGRWIGASCLLLTLISAAG